MSKINTKQSKEIQQMGEHLIENVIELLNSGYNCDKFISKIEKLSEDYYFGVDGKNITDKFLDVFFEIANICVKIKDTKNNDYTVRSAIEEIFRLITLYVHEAALSISSEISIKSYSKVLENHPYFNGKFGVSVSHFSIVVRDTIEKTEFDYEICYAPKANELFIRTLLKYTDEWVPIGKYDKKCDRIVIDLQIINELNQFHLQKINEIFKRVLTNNLN